MATSLNGWPAFDDYGDPRLATGTIPGTTRKVTLAKDVLPLFLHFLAAWNKEMPARLKLGTGPVDGFEPRQARASSGLSNHASGTAVDVRYDVLAADDQRHMTDEEQAVLRRILSRYVTSDGHWVLANGWRWNKVDEMHTECSQGWDYGAKRNTTLADVQEVTKRLRIRPDGTTSILSILVPPKPAPDPAPKPVPAPVPSTVRVSDVQPGKSNSGVGLVQKALKVLGMDPGAVDGAFGPKTQAAYAAWQRRLGYSGSDADGRPGIKSLTALGQRRGFKVVP